MGIHGTAPWRVPCHCRNEKEKIDIMLIRRYFHNVREVGIHKGMLIAYRYIYMSVVHNMGLLPVQSPMSKLDRKS